MELFLLSIVAVAIAEIGDRSMFLAAVFGMRCRSAWAVFWGMATGLFLNQLLSAVVGIWLFAVIATDWHLWVVGAAFLIMAIWVLFPEDDEDEKAPQARSAFLAATVAFFLFEMLDKTQLAVVTLAGASGALLPVVLGATVGILLITTPALILGKRFAARIPAAPMRWIASGMFLLIGLWTWSEAGNWIPDLGLPDLSGFLMQAVENHQQGQ
ncbi:TMEM165/GDT1 family protein [Thioalkalivibrio sp. HL-Eb18]|uniref:TMEM165/GDT1 family protein n=1 Tax=Thioalkalivibrio sp. HL-Eb18 TaxID=1266913 RepID=UPI00035CEF72|nr:TMEM165/GDT1 family protein [Thioalkalivibrio sp. HL-Eb18]